MKKTMRIFGILLIAAMLMSTLAITGFAAEPAETSYDGTPVTPTKISSSTYKSLGLAADKWSQYDGYYAIRNASELYGFAELVNAGDAYAKAVLLDDIVVNSGTVSATGSSSGTTHYWYGIGGTEKENYFRGTFDGNGHYVSGIYYKEPEGQSVSFVGFFRVLAGATVKNLTLKNTYFYAESDIGAIAGYAIGSTSNLTNCRVEADVTVVKGYEGQEPNLGGILGGTSLGGSGFDWPVYCRITNSVFLGTVQAMSSDFKLGATNCEYIGSISGTSCRTGNAHKHVELSNCYYRNKCIIDENGNNEYKSISSSSMYDFNTANGGAYDNKQTFWGNNTGATAISSTSDSHNPAVGEHVGIKEGDSDYKYCTVCGKKIATITIEAPTSYALPGASMQLTAKTEYSEVTSFSIASGTNYTASGMTFKTSVDALVGSEIKVKVTSAETTNVHAAEATITLKVGVVDSTAEIAKLQEELDNAIAELSAALMAEDEDLSDEIDALQKAMTNAQNAIATLQNNSATKAQLTTLENTLKQADEEITAAYTKAINDAKSELKTLIDATEEALRNAINTNSGDIAALTADLVAKYNELIALIGQLPDGVESVSAYVESVNNTLDAAIKQVQKNLDDATDELRKADAANAEALAEAIVMLKEAIEQAQQTAIAAVNLADEALKQQLLETMSQADRMLEEKIAQVQKNLDDATDELRKAMEDGDTNVENQVKAVSDALEAAKTALIAADEANKLELEGKLNTAQTQLQSAIDKVAADLETAKNELAAAIAAGDTALDNKITALNGALNNAIAAYKAADRSVQSTLTGLIQETEATLQNAIDKVAADLAAAEQALNEAIATGDKALDDKIAALNTAMENAIAATNAASEAADEALKAELAAAVATLNEAIAKVQKNLDNAKAELVAQDQVMTAELERLNTFITVVCVIASVGVAGCLGLVIYIVIDKRKLMK